LTRRPSSVNSPASAVAVVHLHRHRDVGIEPVGGAARRRLRRTGLPGAGDLGPIGPGDEVARAEAREVGEQGAHLRARRVDELLVHVRDDLRVVVGDEPALVEQQAALAVADDRLQAVRDEQHGAAIVLEALHHGHALLLEGLVADRQRLVDDEHVLGDDGLDGEGEAHDHAARVDPDGLVHEGADVGEGGDLLEAVADLLDGEAEDAAVDEDVLASSELRVEAAAEFEQRRDVAAQRDGSLGRRHRAGEDLEQGALAAAVPADDADGLAAADGEVHVPQRPELAGPRSPQAPEERVREPVLGPAPEHVALAEARGRRDDVAIAPAHITSAKPRRRWLKQTWPNHAKRPAPTVQSSHGRQSGQECQSSSARNTSTIVVIGL
jgi:hypothetical protein